MLNRYQSLFFNDVSDKNDASSKKTASIRKFIGHLATVVLLVSTFSFTFVKDAQAASATGHTKVTLLETLNLQESKVVNYGALVNENGTCTLNAQGKLLGSNGSSCSGEGELGEFLISGKDDQVVSISVAPGESVSGATFTPSLHSSSTAVLDGGNTTVLIGGNLSLNNATSGSHTISYTISVNYN